MPRRSSLKITERTIARLEVPAKGARKYRDGELRGFAVQVSYTGTRHLAFAYSIGGRERLYTFGRWPAMTVPAARIEARRLQAMVDAGIDPLAVRSAERDAPTVDDLVRRYKQDHLPRKAASSQRDDTALGEMLVAKLGNWKIADVRHSDVDGLHRQVTRAGSPIRANRLAALGSRLWSLAIKWAWAQSNPWKGIERNPENKRSRYLTPAEVQRLCTVLDSDAYKEQQSGNAVRLALLTGARRGEVLSATWSQFDFTHARWVKPSSHTKSKKEHRVPLSAPALKILLTMKAKSGKSPYLFPGDTPDKHQGDLKNFWAAVCRKAEIEGARFHDLRHTHASLLASSGMSLPIIGALLGHTQASTTHRYSHLMDDPLRAATERVGALITNGTGTPAEVVPLHQNQA